MADFLTISLQKSGIYFPQPSPKLFSMSKQMIRPVPKLENVSEQFKSQQNQRTSVIVWSPPTTPTNKFMPPSPPQTPTTPTGTPLNYSPTSPNVIPPRGRPRADVVNILMKEGQNSYSSIRCDVCNRVFPREKSLQAHKRTHSGETVRLRLPKLWKSFRPKWPTEDSSTASHRWKTICLYRTRLYDSLYPRQSPLQHSSICKPQTHLYWNPTERNPNERKFWT